MILRELDNFVVELLGCLLFQDFYCLEMKYIFTVFIGRIASIWSMSKFQLSFPLAIFFKFSFLQELQEHQNHDSIDRGVFRMVEEWIVWILQRKKAGWESDFG